MWGKIIGGVAGFAMGGPLGAMAGMALGHAAESGGLQRIGAAGMNAATGQARARLGGGLGGAAAPAISRDQLFAIGVVVLSAKLAKCDGPVNRAEIDQFKRFFIVPPGSAREVGRLFDQARDNRDSFAPYADQLGEVFSDNRAMLEDILGALFAIARADRPVNAQEQAFLRRVWQGFALGAEAWTRASGAAPGRPSAEDNPYAALGVSRDISDEDVRAAWLQLMRDNHPDTLASRGVPAEFVARASDKVARINAAWDRIKRERGL